MRLEYRRLRLDSPDFGFAKRLYERAFPPEERPSFRRLLSWEEAHFYEVRSEDKPVGLVDKVTMGDLTYVFFLAIASRYRNKGIGTQIIADVLEEERQNGNRVYLLAEEPEPWYEDYPLRQRRIAFYERNGFILTPIRIYEMGVYYRLLKAGSYEVKGEEFLTMMHRLIGDKLFHDYYEKGTKVEES